MSSIWDDPISQTLEPIKKEEKVEIKQDLKTIDTSDQNQDAGLTGF